MKDADSRALLEGATSCPMVVLSTNIAETSCTINGLDAVIDFATEKIAGRDGLHKVSASKASCKQRRGRAGRVKEGFSLLMLRKAQYDELAEFRAPAVCRLPLSTIILSFLHQGHLINTSEAAAVLAELPTPPSTTDLDKDVDTLEIFHLTAKGYLTNTGKAAAEMNLPIEHAVILLSAAFLGVGEFASILLAAASSENLLEGLCRNPEDCKSRKRAWFSGVEPCDLLFLARSMENYIWNDEECIADVARELFEAVMQEVSDYDTAIASFLKRDASVKYTYVTDVWPLLHWAFANGRKQYFSLHLKKWQYRRLTDDSLCVVHNLSTLEYQTSSISFPTLLFNGSMRRVTHCTSLEVLAFGGLRLHGSATGVSINNEILLDMDWSPQPTVLQLGQAFAVLLDDFCAGVAKDSDVDGLRKVIGTFNKGVASCSLVQSRTTLGYSVAFDSCAGRPSAATDSSSSQGFVPVPFDAGKHLCKEHGPKNAQRKKDPKYWFFKAASDGCKACLKFCVESHGIPKDVTSDTQGYTAEDFARHAGHDDVAEFLASWQG